MRIDVFADRDYLDLPDDVILEYSNHLELAATAQRLPIAKQKDYTIFDVLKKRVEWVDRKAVHVHDGEPQVYRYRVDPPSFMISPYFKGVQRTIFELGIPARVNDVYFSRLWRAGEFIEERGRTFDYYQRLTVETFGVQVDAVPIKFLYEGTNSPKNPRLPRYWLTPSYELIQIWRIRVLPQPIEWWSFTSWNPITACEMASLYLEERWHPVFWESVMLGGLQRRHDSFSGELARFYRDASRILARHKRKAGRPPGTRQYTRESFVKTAEKMYRELWKETGRMPARKTLALRMSLSYSGFKSYWRETNRSWPPHDWSID